MEGGDFAPSLFPLLSSLLNLRWS